MAADRLADARAGSRTAADRPVATGQQHHPATGQPSDAGQEDTAPTLVLPVEQAEELFSAEAGPQAEQFLTLLDDLVGRINATETGLIVAATIRTDRYEAMQNHAALDGLGTALFNELKPMPATQFERVITAAALPHRSTKRSRDLPFSRLVYVHTFIGTSTGWWGRGRAEREHTRAGAR